MLLFLPGYMPTSLPVSCLTMAPRADTLEMFNHRKPLTENNYPGKEGDEVFIVPTSPARKAKPVEGVKDQKMSAEIRKMLITLREQLGTVIKVKPAREPLSSEEGKILIT